MTETNDTTPAPRGASSDITFTAPVADLLSLLAGGNIEDGKSPAHVADAFFENAADHVAHELEMLGGDMLSGEMNLGSLETHLWRLGRMLRSASRVARRIRVGEMAVAAKSDPWAGAIDALHGLRASLQGDRAQAIGEIVDELEMLRSGKAPSRAEQDEPTDAIREAIDTANDEIIDAMAGALGKLERGFRARQTAPVGRADVQPKTANSVQATPEVIEYAGFRGTLNQAANRAQAEIVEAVAHLVTLDNSETVLSYLASALTFVRAIEENTPVGGAA